MRFSFLRILVLSLLTFFITGPAVAATQHVVMKSISYDPKTLEIAEGDTVVWSNKSYTEHSATGDGFDTGLIPPGQVTKAVSFAKSGTYPYHCSMHGKSMSGVIVVHAKTAN